tara:strand:+ start:730 stop:10539 length:9810 start_codon:yes stop_codon:yes gene_type:complete
MPEITNNFTQGRMNQDLDKRLIPKGEYISATNAQIGGSSNFSGDGVLAAVKGNEIIAANVPTNSVCIGSISDEAKNKLYWFTTQSGVSNDPDCIFEYDQEQDTTTVVFRDVNMNVLKFPNDFITGINIIDDFLFWTDGHGEPKKISISRSIQGTPQAGGHTQLFVNNISLGDILEEHITVIKKKPEEPPTIRVTSSIEDINLTDENGNITTVNKSINPVFEKIFPRFAVRYKYVDGEYSAIGPFSDVVFKPKFFENRNADTSYSFKEPYHLAMVNCISTIELANFVPSNIPLDVVQVDLLYMQENSSVVYSIDSVRKIDAEWSLDGIAQGGGDINYLNVFDYSVASGNSRVLAKGRYEVRTENIYAALPDNQLLRNYDNVPRVAQAQEITGNRIVYANYTQNYDIKDVNYNDYTPKLSSTYNLRYNAFETFLEGGLKSVKSQREYQVGVVFGDEYGRETPVFTSDQSFVAIPWQGDYGLNASQSLLLESSVINGAPSWAKYFKFFVKNTAGEYYNLVMDKAYDPPTQTDFENEDDHVWISFASTDRNKITIDDYIILKKVFDAGNTGSTGQVGEENRFKILDIQNNVPDSISYKYYNLGIAKQAANTTATPTVGLLDSFTNDQNTFNASGDALFPDDNNKPDIASNDTIIISRPCWAGDHILQPLTGSDINITAQDFSDNTKGLYISWSAEDHPGGTKNSKRYKITSIDGSDDIYKIKLAESISDDDTLIARPPTSQTVITAGQGAVMNETLQVKVERKERRNYENFSGKFFVKIHGNSLIKDKVFDFLIGPSSDDFVVGSFNLFRWADGNGINSGNDATEEVVNPHTLSDTQFDNTTTTHHLPSDITSSTIEITNKESDWDALINNTFTIDIGGVSTPVPGGFIVDEMYLAGSNPHNDSYAKHAGQGWKGATHLYPEQIWRPVSIKNANTNNFSNNGFPDFGPAYVGQGQTSPDQGGSSYIVSDVYGASEGYVGSEVIGTFGTTSIANENNPPSASTGNLDGHWNAMEGAIETQGQYILTGTFGQRRWLDGGQDGLNTSNLDFTYGTVSGKNIVHISFVAPGEDLHNGDGLTTGNVPQYYYFRGSGTDGYDDVLSVRMQGIWGGGWFSDGNMLGNSLEQFICFEGNWGPVGTHNTNTFGGGVDNMAGWFQTPAPNQCGVNNNQGYNLAFQQKHEDQWKPNKTDNSALNAAAEEFLNTMIPGAKFRFKDDTDAEVYTILSRKEKHLYNHTPWRKRWVYNGSNFVAGGDSVEEAALAWAHATGAGGGMFTGNEFDHTDQVDFPSDFGYGETSSVNTVSEWDTLAARIVDFGRANNRRTCYIFEFDKDIKVPSPNGFSAYSTDGFDINDFLNIEIVSDNPQVITGEINEKPAIWETEPLQNDELNIYHEVSANIPLKITADNFELLAPTGCRVEFPNLAAADPGFSLYINHHSITGIAGLFTVRDIQNDAADGGFNYLTGADYADQEVRFYRDNGSYTTAIIDGTYPDPPPGPQGYRSQFRIKLDIDLSKKFGLSYYNTFSFGDGVESSRVRAGFNEMKFTNGPKASATLEEPYETEVRKNGLIYSGIYNSTSGVNNLNQFISAEKITKDINPTYGEITKLFSRKTDLITLCEDRILKILANKDAVFNADGNPQLVASANVLGQAVPFAGDYGCQHAESVDVDTYRLYFADKQRKAVLRLSMDGLTPISDAGMRTWFKENLTGSFILGTYDNDEEEYNLTIGNSELVLTNQNIVNNSYFDEGDSFYQINTLGDIVVDGFAPSGNPLLYDDPSVIEEVPNLNPDVIIINWPEIPAGSINSGSLQGIDQQFVAASYGTPGINSSSGRIFQAYATNSDPVQFSHTYPSDPAGSMNVNLPVISSNNSFGHPFKNGGVGWPLSKLKRYIDGVEQTGSVSGGPFIDDFSGNSYSTWDTGLGYTNENPCLFVDWGNITYPTYNGVGQADGKEGITFYNGDPNNGGVLEVRAPGTYEYPGSANQFESQHYVHPNVRDWVNENDPNSMPYNANAVDYSNIASNTIFAGEEIYVYCELEYADGYTSFGLGPGQFPISPPNYLEPDISIHLYDGSTELNNFFVITPAQRPCENIAYPGISSLYSPLSTDIEDFGQISSLPVVTNGMDFAQQNWSAGVPITENTYKKMIAFQIKFKGDTLAAGDVTQILNQGFLDEEKIVVNDLQVGIKIDGTALDQTAGALNGVMLNKLSIGKLFRLIKPSIPTFNNQTGTGTPFPATTIPAWTQVAPKDLSTSNYSFNNINYAGAGPNSNWTLTNQGVSGGFGSHTTWNQVGFNPYANHVDTYGIFNYPEALTGQDDQGNAVTIYAGENNGTIDPSSYTLSTLGNPSAYSNNDGPTPTYQIFSGTVATKIDVGSLTNIAPYNFNTGVMRYTMQTPFQIGNWYYVRAEVNNAALITASNTYNTYIVLEDVVDSTPLNWGAAQSGGRRSHAQGNPTYPDWHFGTVTNGNTAHSDGSISLYPCSDVSNPTNSIQQYAAIFQFNGSNPNELKFKVGIDGSSLSNFSFDYIQIRDITNYNSGGGDVANWSSDAPSYVPDFTGIPGFMDFLLYNTNTAIVTWPFETYHRDDKLCFRNAAQNGYDHWYQEFDSANNSNLAPDVPSLGGYKLSFRVHPEPITGTISGELVARVANKVGDFAPAIGPNNAQCAGVRLTGIDQTGDYEIYFNFDDGSSFPPYATRNGNLISGVDMFHDLGANWYEGNITQNSISFRAGATNFTGAVDQIVLEDQTVGFGGGTANSWSLVNNIFDFNLTPYVVWDNVNENIQLNSLQFPVQPWTDINGIVQNPNGYSYQIEQNLGHINFNNSSLYRFSANIFLEAFDPATGNQIVFSENDTYPEILIYYYNTNGEGFEVGSLNNHNVSYTQTPNISWYLPTGQTNYNNSGTGSVNTPVNSNGQTIQFDIDGEYMNPGGGFYQNAYFGAAGMNLQQGLGLGLSNAPYGALQLGAGTPAPYLQNTLVIVINGVEGSPVEQYRMQGYIDNVQFIELGEFDEDEFTTISYKEQQKGWVSFKTFYPENGLSLGSKYYTFKNANLYEHHKTNQWCVFYGTGTTVGPDSVSVKFVLNDSVNICKEFHSLNFKGSLGRNNFFQSNNEIDLDGDQIADLDYANFLEHNDHFNAHPQPGWSAESIVTDLEEGTSISFVKKENKWFSDIRGRIVIYSGSNDFSMGDFDIVSPNQYNFTGDINNTFGIGVVEQVQITSSTPLPSSIIFEEENNQLPVNVQQLPQQQPQSSPVPPAQSTPTPPPSTPSSPGAGATGGSGSSGGGY